MFIMARRLIGYAAVAVAIMILGTDLTAMLAKGGAFSAHSIGQDWQVYSSGSYVGFKSWLEHALPAGSVGYIEVVLGLWTWAALALVGVLIAPLRHASRWNEG